jgi:hypothetical protein
MTEICRIVSDSTLAGVDGAVWPVYSPASCLTANIGGARRDSTRLED